MTRSRAESMPRDERRRAIIEATVPLLREHGRTVTSRQIATAAGIAEGTVFRAFASKEELLDAALDAAFDPTAFVAAIDAIEADAPLTERLVDVVRLMQARFRDVFAMMAAMGLSRPSAGVAGRPPASAGAGGAPGRHLEWRRLAEQHIVLLLQPDAHRFRVPLTEVVSTLRLLTFSGTHPHISAHPLEAEEIVDRVLFGVLQRPAPEREVDPC